MGAENLYQLTKSTVVKLMVLKWDRFVMIGLHSCKLNVYLVRAPVLMAYLVRLFTRESDLGTYCQERV